MSYKNNYFLYSIEPIKLNPIFTKAKDNLLVAFWSFVTDHLVRNTRVCFFDANDTFKINPHGKTNCTYVIT